METLSYVFVFVGAFDPIFLLKKHIITTFCHIIRVVINIHSLSMVLLQCQQKSEKVCVNKFQNFIVTSIFDDLDFICY